MHLPVEPRFRAVGIDDIGAVVIDPRRAALEKRNDDDYFELPGQFAEGQKGWAVEGLGQIEMVRVLALAEI